MRAALIVVGLTAALVAAAFPPVPSTCSGAASTIPVWDQPPKFLRQVPNGKLFEAGTGNDTFRVVHVWGTPYQKGLAHGQLYERGTVDKLYARFVKYVEGQFAGNHLPEWALKLIATYGVDIALDFTIGFTRPFTPVEYVQEMQGIADGQNVSLNLVWRLNMFPEMIKAACTIVGAYGPATPTGTIGHLRGLDFDPTNPLVDWPQVTVYHGDTPQTTFANFGWFMIVGSLTGISQHGIGIGEKVWLNHPESINGVHGKPWMFILRDTLTTANMAAALSSMETANRTCAIHVGVGDATTNTFRGVTMAKRAFDVYTDTTLNYTEHPALAGVVYWDKHAQPSHHWCLGQLLQASYGNLNAATLLNVSAAGATGNMHSATFDYQNLVAYFAVARRTTNSVGPLNAYARQWTRLDVRALFQEAPPSQ